MLAEYLEAQVLTAPPHRLHLLVVEAAIRFSRQALAAFADQDWPAGETALSRARACVAELLCGIRTEVAPDLAERQNRLWLFAYRCLALGELLHDRRKVEDALRILELHRETWLELSSRLLSGEKASVPEPHLSSWLG